MNNQSLVETSLVENGFYKLNVPSDPRTNAKAFYQKRVRSRWFEKDYDSCVENKTLYFVNVWVYSDVIECEAIMYMSETEHFTCTRTIENTSVENVLSFYASLFEKLNCVPDVHNND